MPVKYTIEEIDWFFYKYSCLKKVLSEQEINTLFSEWKSNNSINPHDYFWLLFNKALMVNAESFRNGGSELDFYNNQSSLYYNMASFRGEEGANKESINNFIRLGHQSIIDNAKYDSLSDSVEMEVIVNSSTKTTFAPEYLCQYGNSENRKKYSPVEFMDKCFIATDKCTREGGCSCSLASVMKRDAEGNLIFKEEIKKNTKSKKEPKGCVMVFIPIIILFTIASIFLLKPSILH